MDTNKLNYKSAGVDIDAGNALVEAIKPHAKRTHRSEVMGGLGGFGALFQLPSGYKSPVLVSATDGVGTKLKLAMALNQHDSIGIDLVAMCVNDLIVQGAEPLFFLDYYATGKLSVETAADVVKGIADGCEQAGAALVGGETAEMPGMYDGNDYDLAGFCVGIVEKDKILTGETVKKGNVLIGLASSGVHSNGFSLVRKVLDTHQISLDSNFHGKTLGETLLTPTKIYVKSILALLKQHNVHALAHITGGGLVENIQRVLPEGTTPKIDFNSWERPEIFKWLQNTGNIDENDMLRTFNCGVGMVVIVEESEASSIIDFLNSQDETAFTIGTVA